MVIDDKAIAINDLIDAVKAIEHELGLTPSGIYSDVRVRLDILESRIDNVLQPAPNVQDPFFIGVGGVSISTGAGAPTENRLPGSLYLRTDGYTPENIYARRPDGYWHLVNSSWSQLLDGYGAGGTAFTLKVDGTSNNLTLENGKSYDINLRILVSNSSGSPTCARYIYDILAHCEAGTLTLDVVNTTLSNDNATGWTVTVSASTNQLNVQINSSGLLDRRAIATAEWRELSRL